MNAFLNPLMAWWVFCNEHGLYMDLKITIAKHDFVAKLSFLLALCPMAECVQVESAGVLRISLHASQENSEMVARVW